jgi:hypothetical protein
MPELTPAQREVLLATGTCDSDCRPYVRTIAQNAGLPAEYVRQTLRYFGEIGLATHGPVFNNDSGAPNGSTWWLTERGTALRAEQEEA